MNERLHVTVFREMMAYGGSEEGGWWARKGEPLKTKLNKSFRFMWMAKLWYRYVQYVVKRWNKGLPEIWSVHNTGGVFKVYLTVGPKAPFYPEAYR